MGEPRRRPSEPSSDVTASMRLALWMQRHPWWAGGSILLVVALLQGAVFLAWDVNWPPPLGTATLVAIAGVPRGALVAAALALLLVASRRRRVDVAASIWAMVAVGLPLAILVPVTLWSQLDPDFRAAMTLDGWGLSRQAAELGIVCVSAVSVGWVVLRLVPLRRSASRPAWGATIAISLLLLQSLFWQLRAAEIWNNAVEHVLSDVVAGIVVIAWCANWVRLATTRFPTAFLWVAVTGLLWWPFEAIVRPEDMTDLYITAPYTFDLVGRLLGALPFLPLLRALDRASLVPDEHPVHDGRA